MVCQLVQDFHLLSGAFLQSSRGNYSQGVGQIEPVFSNRTRGQIRREVERRCAGDDLPSVLDASHQGVL